MGCVASSEEDVQKQPKQASLKEREEQARANRKGATSIVHNLVNEEFGRDIREIYDIDGDILGEGIQGVVRTVVHKQTGVRYAMKTVPLGAGKNSKAMAQLRSELALIRMLDHPNIVRLQEVYETEESLFLVMDLCTGGDMMTRWERNRRLRYSEAEAALTVKKIVNAVRYCHQQHVVHRDIKLENLLWEHPGDDAEPQLVDFGLGVTFSDDSDVFREDVGSLYYVAPEVLGRNYTKACDCWSIGVIAYMLLAGMPPFMAPSDEGVKLKIKWSKPGFPKEHWEKVSEDAKDFIKRLLVKAPTKRMTAEEASAHPWLANGRTKSSMSATDSSPPLEHIERPLDGDAGEMRGTAMPSSAEDSVPLDAQLIRRLKKFTDYGKLKRVALEVIAHSLSPAEIRTLRREYQKVDIDGRGEIKPIDLQKAMNASGNYTEAEISRMFSHMDVDHDGKIGFNEFLAASLKGEHIKDENLRMAFSRLDHDNSGTVTFEKLANFTGATVDDEQLETQITDDELRDALLGGDGDGVSYDVFRRAMVKSFSTANLDSPGVLRTLVRAASKMSIEELAVMTGGSQEDAGTIITASHLLMNSNTSSDVGAARTEGELRHDGATKDGESATGIEQYRVVSSESVADSENGALHF